jgi:hypothetical protein
VLRERNIMDWHRAQKKLERNLPVRNSIRLRKEIEAPAIDEFEDDEEDS